MRSSINLSIRLGINLGIRLGINLKADTWPDTRVDTPCAPFEVGYIFIISLHKFLVEKYVKIHKIERCYLL